MQYKLTPSTTFTGTHKVAPDKSISHRSIMLGSLANGVTQISNFLEGEDALSTLQAFVDMGVKIDRNGDKVTIEGVGLHGLKPPKNAPNNTLNMGNSGTSMRLLAGILSAQKFDSVMIGDKSLSKRPMERVAKPLRAMGAKVQTTGEKGTPPVKITGNQGLKGMTYHMPMASAQVKSCLLLAGMWADGETCVIEPQITRDHTERMLQAFGYQVTVKQLKQGNEIRLTGGSDLTACNIEVPADISSAAFFMVAATIANNGDVVLPKVGINPTRTGVIEILTLMGANITLVNQTMVGGEPVADICIKSAKLQGIDIPPHLVPLAIDEFPVLFVAASCATGKTVLRGAAELRVKESDRIAVMADGLKTLGVDCTVLTDGIEIIGKGEQYAFGSGVIDSHHDHRIAMSFAVASLRASGDIEITGTETVNTSFPNFAKLVGQAGLNIDVVD
nr:3-phosphoshikimate 1-carboxyvinyltransferase [Moraxella macacae]